MDHERHPDELKAELDQQRVEMAETVAEIEDRVAPGSVIERGREQATELVEKGRTEVRRRVDELRRTDDDPGATPAGGTAATALRVASTAAERSQPAVGRIREETVHRPWPMLAVAFVIGLLLGRRVG